MKKEEFLDSILEVAYDDAINLREDYTEAIFSAIKSKKVEGNKELDELIHESNNLPEINPPSVRWIDIEHKTENIRHAILIILNHEFKKLLLDVKDKLKVNAREEIEMMYFPDEDEETPFTDNEIEKLFNVFLKTHKIWH